MSIFKKKLNTYKIHCDLDKTVRVQKFAEKHAAMGTVVETRAHGPLLAKDVRVTVTVKSNDNETVMYKDFLETFKNHKIRIDNNSMFVYKEEELV